MPRIVKARAKIIHPDTRQFRSVHQSQLLNRGNGKTGHLVVRRKTVKKRMRAKLQALKAELRRRMYGECTSRLRRPENGAKYKIMDIV